MTWWWVLGFSLFLIYSSLDIEEIRNQEMLLDTDKKRKKLKPALSTQRTRKRQLNKTENYDNYTYLAKHHRKKKKFHPGQWNPSGDLVFNITKLWQSPLNSPLGSIRQGQVGNQDFCPCPVATKPPSASCKASGDDMGPWISTSIRQ